MQNSISQSYYLYMIYFPLKLFNKFFSYLCVQNKEY